MNINIPGYSIQKTLFESSSSVIFKAKKEGKNSFFAVKTISKEYPSASDIARIEHEYSLSKHCHDVNGVVATHEFVQYGNNRIIIMDYVEGEPLNNILSRKEKLSISIALKISLNLAKILGKIHQCKVIHKDINPSNILYDIETNSLNIIDFGLATVLSTERQDLNVSPYEGSLPYISPEQTGRMNREIDYRSDFYSMGITLYELFTGRLPFKADNALEWVHCHISQVAPSPREITPDIPLIVSEIIMKLIAKNAEDRYQSSASLIADLEECNLQWRLKEKIDVFPFAQNDVSENLQIPKKLYGRENEIRILLETFNRVTRGNTEFVLVSGYSGIGKSALVHEVHQPLVKHGGYFITGKCDQFKRNIPYYPMIESFKDLTRQILTEDEESLKAWRDKLLLALGDNGQVVVDVIPQLEILIGRQEKIPELGPIENQNRFNRIFFQFVTVFKKRDHPLVIFLDDLQWADHATLSLIDVIMGGADSKYLYLLGAYRDNEVDDTHRLVRMLEKIRKTKEILSFALSTLSDQQTEMMISDILQSSVEEVSDLSQLVFEKTQGNPFFVNMFMRSLYQENLILFDRIRNKWRWDIDEIQEKSITNNVVELMIDRIKKLDGEAQEKLSLAAAIGNQFNLYSLALVCESSPIKVYRMLWGAIQQHLIVPAGKPNSFPNRNTEASRIVAFRFHHDRVQQAAYALIPDENKADLHLNIGRLLLKNRKVEEADDDLFEIVSHLNKGNQLIHDENEKYKLAKLNLDAAKKAKLSSAYDPALEYISRGIEMLDQKMWESNYDFVFLYYLEKGEIEYLNSKWDQALETFEHILNHSQSLLDRVKVSEYKITLYRMKNELNLSLETGINALSELGLTLRAFPTEKELEEEMHNLDRMLEGCDIERLFDLPEMNNKNDLSIMILLRECVPAAYFLGSRLLFILGIKMTQITLQSGNNPHASVGYIFLSSYTFPAIANDFKKAYQFGLLALRLNDEKYHIKAYEAVILNQWGGFVSHHTEHIDKARSHLMRGYYSGVDNGNYQWAGYAAINCLFMDFWGPDLLPEVASKIDTITPGLKKIDPNMVQYYFAIKASIHNLTHSVVDRCHLSEELWPNVDKVISDCKEKQDLLTLFVDSVCRLSIANIFLQYKKALEFSNDAENYVQGASGIFINSTFIFHQCLAFSSSYRESESAERKQYLTTIRENEKKLEMWSENCPGTYLHQLLLVKAELAAIEGEDILAIDLFEKSIKSAQENSFLQNQAMACERFGIFWRLKHNDKIANLYFIESYFTYEQWGAIEKLAAMKESYSLTDEMLLVKSKPAYSNNSNLDMMTIVKSSHAISEEIQLERLLITLMRYTMENAGADRGFFVLIRNEKLVLEVEGKDNNIMKIGSKLINKDDNFPYKTIKYVARVKEKFVLDDAMKNNSLLNDPYFCKNNVHSILCLPIIHQRKLLGVLYLENSVINGAFTKDQVALLSLLASQAAVSIENALIYRSLEEKVKERTDELNDTNEHLHEELIARYKAEKAMKKALEDIAYIAQYDQLTGVYNRRMFMTLLSESLAQAKRTNCEVALHFIDLDHFKKINDTHGHDSGDETLIEAVARIKDTVREIDIVARLGGDEFGIVQKIDKGKYISAASLAQRIINAFAPQFKLQNNTVHMSCSIGIALYPDHGDSSKSLIKAADTAMYYVKGSGRNEYRLFNDVLRKQLDRHVAIATELHGAIERNELNMVYQPQIDSHNGTLIGFEALMRWENRRLHVIGPSQFFPIAESIGIVSQLDEWGLSQALSQASAWNRSSSSPINISVNVSVQQLRSPRFVNFVSSQLKKTGLDPSLLILEITETVLMSKPEECIAHIDQLHKLGIEIAIDDFGTGYSSLSYLSVLPVEYLKIDRAFIANIDKNTTNQKIVCSIIGLARSLDFKSIAEGVETQEELDYLLSVDCTLIQGYYFSKPIPKDAAMEFIRTWPNNVPRLIPRPSIDAS